MLETIWESRWLPDTLKNNSGWKTTKGFIIEIRVTKESWYFTSDQRQEEVPVSDD